MSMVSLSSPITIAGRVVAAIELRPLSLRSFEAMRGARGEDGFADNAAIKFIARCSGHQEGTIRRLPTPDLAALGRELERLYADAARRYGVRAALSEAKRLERKAAARARWAAGDR